MLRPIALLDANVLYPARLRDLLMRLAIAGQYQARWSDQILDECFDSLAGNRPDLLSEHLRRTRHLMGVAVPDAIVVDYEHLIDGLDLPDRDDRHVLAAAITAQADNLVTANLGDFPSRSMPTGLSVVSPDDFLLTLIRADLDAVATIIDTQASSLSNPPMTTAELLDGLDAIGLQRSVHALRHAAS